MNTQTGIRELTEQQRIGRRIKAARVLAGMSRWDLAAEMGWPAEFVKCLENGQEMLSSNGLLRLSKVLDKPVDYLMWTDTIERRDVQEEVEDIVINSFGPRETIDAITEYIWLLVRRLQ